MGQDPTLVIQVQRMGDLVMSFSLINKLLYLEPRRPLWVVAEPYFYEPLCSIAPNVVFFSPAMRSELKTRFYKRVVNVSHTKESAQLAGSLVAEEHIGFFSKNAALYIKGGWRLYRASIVENNRYNNFHWSDLESLGLIPQDTLEKVVIKPPRPIGTSGNVGIFVGASERTKRPDAHFWGLLSRYLANQGLSPIFLGGPSDAELANEAVKASCLSNVKNFTGKFSLSELVHFFQTLDVLVTPDTGPMHLAAFTGIPTIDLSMGNVSPWETAVLQPGHTVVIPAISCVGCWTCEGRDFICRQAFTPEKIGRLVLSLLEGKDLDSSNYTGIRVYKTSRDNRGLFSLQPFFPTGRNMSQRFILSLFWKEWFISILGGTVDRFFLILEMLSNHYPQLLLKIKEEVTSIYKLFLKVAQNTPLQISPGFWRNDILIIRPLTGYLDLLIQNGDYKKEVWEQALYMLSTLIKRL